MHPQSAPSRAGKARRSHCALIAICGGSGSGKSWLAEKLVLLLPNAARLSLDDFYRDRSALSSARRARLNFDYPRAIDWVAFEAALRRLAFGQAARIPCYDFVTHSRTGEKLLEPKRVVLVDGLWLLRRPSVRRLFALAIYLDCPSRLRFQRRLSRDSASRGRTLASIRHQFRSMVEPMHRRFVTPQFSRADIRLGLCRSADVRRLAQFIGRLAGDDQAVKHE